MCLVILHGMNEPRLGVIDLRSGAVAELGVAAWWMPVAEWSPDGRFVFFLGGPNSVAGWGVERILMVYERQSGDSFPVSNDQTRWETLAARPVER